MCQISTLSFLFQTYQDHIDGWFQSDAGNVKARRARSTRRQTQQLGDSKLLECGEINKETTGTSARTHDDAHQFHIICNGARDYDQQKPCCVTRISSL